MAATILAGVFCTLIAWSVVTDLTRMIIPNWLSLAVPALFFPAALLAGLSLADIGWHVALGAGAFVVCLVLFYTNVFGGGDAKLIPGVMLWTGLPGAMPFLFWMALVGGVVGLVLLTLRRVVPAGDVIVLQRTSGVPYAVAIAAGVVMAAPHMALMQPLLASFPGIF